MHEYPCHGAVMREYNHCLDCQIVIVKVGEAERLIRFKNHLSAQHFLTRYYKKVRPYKGNAAGGTAKNRRLKWTPSKP